MLQNINAKLQNAKGKMKMELWRNEEVKIERQAWKKLKKRLEMLHEQCQNDEATKFQSKVAKFDNNATNYKYKAIKQCDKTQ